MDHCLRRKALLLYAGAICQSQRLFPSVAPFLVDVLPRWALPLDPPTRVLANPPVHLVSARRCAYLPHSKREAWGKSILFLNHLLLPLFATPRSQRLRFSFGSLRPALLRAFFLRVDARQVLEGVAVGLSSNGERFRVLLLNRLPILLLVGEESDRRPPLERTVAKNEREKHVVSGTRLAHLRDLVFRSGELGNGDQRHRVGDPHPLQEVGSNADGDTRQRLDSPG